MNRRTALKLVVAGVLPSSDGLIQIASSQDTYSPEFFSKTEFGLVDDLTETILPADDQSPGAKAAKVGRYIDVIVADGDFRVQQNWRDGLRTVARHTKKVFNKDFADCSAEQQDTIVAEMAQNEGDPGTELERFFAIVKRTTVDGYYTSEIGIHENLQYKGNTAIAEFLGCTHSEHREAKQKDLELEQSPQFRVTKVKAPPSR